MDPDTQDFDQQLQSPGQQSDWEERFKGLQRKYNADHQSWTSEKSRLEAALEGSRATATTLQQRVTDLEAGRAGEATAHEQALTELRGQVAQFEATLAEKDGTIGQLEKQVHTNVAKDMVRKQLKGDFAQLLPFFEAGFLSDLTELEGDALQERLQEAASVFNNETTSKFQKALDGTTPGNIPGSAQQNLQTDASPDNYEAWLNDPANANDPRYAEVYDKYIETI